MSKIDPQVVTDSWGDPKSLVGQGLEAVPDGCCPALSMAMKV